MAKGKARKQYNNQRRSFNPKKQPQRDNNGDLYFESDLRDETKKKRRKKTPKKKLIQGYAELLDPSK